MGGMVPHLEQLEPRDGPTTSFGFNIVEVRAPLNIAAQPGNPFAALAAALFDTNVLLFLGQFPQLHLGIPSVPHELIRYDVTPAQWQALFGMPPTTGRWVAPVAGGQMPIVFVPDGINAISGLQWEQSALLRGWWYGDPPGITNAAAIPPGPQAGQPFTAPNFVFADVLFANGNPYFWLAL